MKKKLRRSVFLAFVVSLLLLAGCGTDDADVITITATTPIEVDEELLRNVSVSLPEGMTRETVSNIQHDFIQDGKQVGGIVIVDISNEMLDSPRNYTSEIAELLGHQLMPTVSPEDIAFKHAGGNEYAYMEISTGKKSPRFTHYIFRGSEVCYDVWFDLKEVKQKSINEILPSIAAEDITPEQNKSVF